MKSISTDNRPEGDNPTETPGGARGGATALQPVLSLFLAWAMVLLISSRTFASTGSVGVILADSRGEFLHEENPDTPFVPASTLKILTSLLALHHLGENHRFPTEIFLDGSDNLIVKGYGDPMLTSEAIQKMAERLAGSLKKKGVNKIGSIVVDDTYFQHGITIPGTGTTSNPYDAPVGAFCANFNTVLFAMAKSRYISAEPQTPLLPFVLDRIKASGLGRGRVILSDKESRTYAGRLLKFFLEKNGITITHGVTRGRVGKEDQLMERFFSSHTVEEDIQNLLLFSNNFMANQLLLACGAKVFSPPATLEKGVRLLNKFAGETLNLKGIVIKEGSGLSRENRITPRQMLTILMAFKPHRSLMKIDGNEFYKTGTMNGIRCRAGFFETKDGKACPFVIMVNTPGRGYDDIRQKLQTMITKM
ncbi:MAG: hypothetical protein B6230_07985 [Desulfobacteraceae bacterium 4572_89]|nr:MAG: hypothetical protein B6230_07985 [Desulfobacteraceae bacterium 4572_89]